MKIVGLQKMTLLDFPGKIGCTVFLGGCDLRCPFCHNAELIDGTAGELCSRGELLDFLKKRVGMLEGVVITGGEPLLNAELGGLLGEIRALGFPVKLDTNGTHPKRLDEILRSGLVQYVAMDVKNSPERYARTAGVTAIDIGKIKQSVGLIMNGGVEYEFRTTVVREFHDESSFYGIADLIDGAKKYFLQPFEDREQVAAGGLHSPTKEELGRYAEIVRPHVGEVGIRGI